MSGHVLHIDLETRSTVDLRKTGVYVYAEDPSTEVMCAAYALDDAPPSLWIPGMMADGKRAIPLQVVGAIEFGYPIIAHNANFERTLWRHVLAKRHGWPEPKLEQWRCTMAMAAAMSLPMSLQNAAAALGLDIAKDMGGRALMLQMSKPRKPRKGEADGIYWFEDDERKQRLYAYCKQDVEVERALEKRLFQLSPSELKLWHLDQKINDRGVCVDTPLCEAALKVVATAEGWLNEELSEITGGEVRRASNVNDLAKWLKSQGVVTESLDKEAIDDLLTRSDLSASVRRALAIRREAAKAAVKKIDALVAGRSRDGRSRGLLQYHSASTGRWAGRRFQPQNIKRPELDDVEGAIEAIRSGDAEVVRLSYGEPLAVVGDTLRGMVKASTGRVIRAADYANIEGRVNAWLFDEHWKLDAFRAFDRGEGPDIYKITAGKILGKPPEAVTKDERQGEGKVSELALGYQGGVGALKKMAGKRVKFSDERWDEIKNAWRNEHPNIVSGWYELEDAGQWAVRNRGKAVTVGRVVFKVAGSFLFLRLPSGRVLVYPYPCIKPKVTPWGETREQVCYQGTDSYTRKWGDCFAYGGLWCENIVQAIARDVMAHAMPALEAAGYPIVLTCHDEIVCEPKEDLGSAEEFEKIMMALPTWAEGLPVAVNSFCAMRYKK